MLETSRYRSGGSGSSDDVVEGKYSEIVIFILKKFEEGIF